LLRIACSAAAIEPLGVPIATSLRTATETEDS
jgi:hypothetical protein